MDNTLSQQLRELAAKATSGPFVMDKRAMGIWKEGTSGKMFDIRGWGYLTGAGSLNLSADEAEAIQRTNGELVALMLTHRETILSALELQERLNAPETVESLAREIMLNREDGGCCVKDWGREAIDNPHVGQAVNQAKAAIAALKGDQ